MTDNGAKQVLMKIHIKFRCELKIVALVETR